MKTVGRHRKDPFEWDMEGAWDGVVMKLPDGRWVRCLDRNGEVYDDIVQK